ncbi:phosphoadenosine phosphosulfate reductase family protein [Desulfonatronum sp. SC1]|uniref:phosphoadenosine phosphosulfate reductase family protein n=1 Tax=Desulfonatronum sp. SC1 TaxID=2109626 RepID=UPI000D31B793|nr:phosphoadenosine phosphosulfate reductase family protein [Desulfonatronum sp. SC1]PTN34471.1 phosphoadenosine phosphosulfate reductase [Desulfonatronum sp. SC1]
MLHEIILHSRRILEQVLAAHGPEQTAVAWTGGKDSTVVLWLWRSLLRERGMAPCRAVNLDTGLKFPEVLELRDQVAREWEIDLHVQRPYISLDDYPVAQNKLACCRDLKILPLQQAVGDLHLSALLTGLRRDESPSRCDRQPVEPRESPDHLQVNPILDWTEMDIWACIMEQGLPYCTLYAQGYRSLGCMPCTVAPDQAAGGGERSGRDQDKERQLETLRSLGYF